MNASAGLWHQWSAQLRAFLPELHGHRSKTLAFCVLGVVLAGTTRLPRVAEALVGISAAKTPSIDRGLVGHPLVQLCAQRGWHDVLRLSAAHTCQPARGRWARGWIPCRHLVPQRGRHWYGSVQLWQEHPLPAQVSATWEPGQKEPGIVLSDPPAGRQP